MVDVFHTLLSQRIYPYLERYTATENSQCSPFLLLSLMKNQKLNSEVVDGEMIYVEKNPGTNHTKLYSLLCLCVYEKSSCLLLYPMTDKTISALVYVGPQ